MGNKQLILQGRGGVGGCLQPMSKRLEKNTNIFSLFPAAYSYSFMQPPPSFIINIDLFSSQHIKLSAINLSFVLGDG